MTRNRSRRWDWINHSTMRPTIQGRALVPYKHWEKEKKCMRALKKASNLKSWKLFKNTLVRAKVKYMSNIKAKGLETILPQGSLAAGNLSEGMKAFYPKVEGIRTCGMQVSRKILLASYQIM